MTEYDPTDDSVKSYYAAIEAKRRFLERVRATFSYNPETGIMTWRERPRDQFVSRRGHSIWNARYAGQEAGSRRKDGYISARLDLKPYLVHRLAWLITYGRWPKFVDHINGDPSDNRLANLREVTISENGQNTKIPSHNKSGVIGVMWCAPVQRWRAAITVNRKTIHLGEFKDFDKAVAARKAAERNLGFHPNHGRDAA